MSIPSDLYLMTFPGWPEEPRGIWSRRKTVNTKSSKERSFLKGAPHRQSKEAQRQSPAHHKDHIVFHDLTVILTTPANAHPRGNRPTEVESLVQNFYFLSDYYLQDSANLWP